MRHPQTMTLALVFVLFSTISVCADNTLEEVINSTSKTAEVYGDVARRLKNIKKARASLSDSEERLNELLDVGNADDPQLTKQRNKVAIDKHKLKKLRGRLGDFFEQAFEDDPDVAKNARLKKALKELQTRINKVLNLATPMQTMARAEAMTRPAETAPVQVAKKQAEVTSSPNRKTRPPKDDKFREIPLVIDIPKSGDSSTFDALKRRVEDEVDYVIDKRFHQPAHITFGGDVEQQIVLIYEGMRFAVKSNGEYEVRFTLESPNVPITLRMALALRDPETSITFPLTVPLIRIPQADSADGPAPRAMRLQRLVVHRGFLPALVTNPAGVEVVERSGWAEAGYGARTPRER